MVHQSLPLPTADAQYDVVLIAAAPSRHHVAFVDLPALPVPAAISEQEALIALLRPLALAVGGVRLCIDIQGWAVLNGEGRDYATYSMFLSGADPQETLAHIYCNGTPAEAADKFTAALTALRDKADAATLDALAGAAAL